MIQAVIFDLDDTLCNASQVLERTLRAVFEENLSHFPGKTIDQMVALNRQAFQEVFLDPSISISSASILIWFKIFELMDKKPPVKAILQMVEKYWEENTNQLTTIPGTLELLDYLKENNIKTGILTNGAFIGQAKKLSILGIEDKIDCFVASDMCMADKPDPKAFLYILNKMEVMPEDAIMVGDRVDNDINGAKHLGMKGILVEHSIVPDNHGADLVVKNLKDCIPYIKSLNLSGLRNYYTHQAIA